MRDRWGNSIFQQIESNELLNLKGKRIVFLCGSLSISGGTNIILTYAQYLQTAGANVTLLYLLGEETDSDWHPSFGKLRIANWNNSSAEKYDLAIFTWWRTVLDCSSVNSDKAAYFVQSLENRFARNNGDIDSEIYAASTYFLELPVITVASWIAKSLFVSTGQNGFVVRNGIDKAIFHQNVIPVETPSLDKLRVLIEGPFDVPMKAVDEAFKVARSINNVEIWHVNPTAQRESVYSKNFSKVPYREMAKIYKSCDVILKLSRVEGMFGPPLEAFHVGSTAVVSRVTGYSEYIKDGENSLSVDVDDFESAALALAELSANRELLQNLKSNALLTAEAWPSIEESAFKFAEVCSLVLFSNSNYRNVRERIKDSFTSARIRYSEGESLAEIFGLFLTP
jgi:hypothetical protein